MSTSGAQTNEASVSHWDRAADAPAEEAVGFVGEKQLDQPDVRLADCTSGAVLEKEDRSRADAYLFLIWLTALNQSVDAGDDNGLTGMVFHGRRIINGKGPSGSTRSGLGTREYRKVPVQPVPYLALPGGEQRARSTRGNSHQQRRNHFL
jgi:hypothetical protein